MSLHLLQLVWQTKLNLLPTEKLVLACLATFANEKNNLLCYPKNSTLAAQCNLSKRHIQRILSNLISFNIIYKKQIKIESGKEIYNYYFNENTLKNTGGGDAHVMGGVTPMSPPTYIYIKDDSINTYVDCVDDASNILINDKRRDEAKEVISFLRKMTGRNYQNTSTSLKLITQRIKEGATVIQCRKVIARKFHDWAHNKKMEIYLRPSTLFNKTNFWDKYIPEIVTDEGKEQIKQQG